MCKMDKEDNTGNEPASEIMLQTIQALKKEADELKKDHQQELDQLSDRLQSIEASVSEILKLDVFAQQAKYDTKKEPESINQKSFKLKHVFNVNRFTEGMHNFSEWEDHCNVKWRMRVERHNNRLLFYIYCDPIAPADKWSIRTKTEGQIGSEKQNHVSRRWENFYEQRVGYGIDFLGWDEMKRWFLVDGNLTVEATVTIIEMTGLAKEKIRMFDESQKDVSDVILVVRNTKFYVLKMFLAVQSSVFKALLLGNEQSEVKLDESDPDDFHCFLEVLYGEPAIDDYNVEAIALLADMYDAPTAARRCQEFLLEKSKKTAEKKREIPTLENLWKTGTVRNHADLKPELTLPDLLVWVFIIMLAIWWKFG